MYLSPVGQFGGGPHAAQASFWLAVLSCTTCTELYDFPPHGARTLSWRIPWKRAWTTSTWSLCSNKCTFTTRWKPGMTRHTFSSSRSFLMTNLNLVYFPQLVTYFCILDCIWVKIQNERDSLCSKGEKHWRGGLRKIWLNWHLWVDTGSGLKQNFTSHGWNGSEAMRWDACHVTAL